MTEVRSLFADKQPGPADGDIGPTFIEVARTVSQICATRMLLMLAVITGSGIWAYTVWTPSSDRLYAAIAFSIVFVMPQVALYWRRG
jgi:multidrug resistance efflux pump